MAGLTDGEGGRRREAGVETVYKRRFPHRLFGRVLLLGTGSRRARTGSGAEFAVARVTPSPRVVAMPTGTLIA